MLKRNSFYKLLGLIVSLPLFFMINSGGVSLPENHYEANGFPFHLALITPLIFFKEYKPYKTGFKSSFNNLSCFFCFNYRF